LLPREQADREANAKDDQRQRVNSGVQKAEIELALCARRSRFSRSAPADA
jgi:hypothetical protein